MALTYLETTANLVLAGERLPAGNYSIRVIPRRGEWPLIFHRDWDVFLAPYPGDKGVALRLEIEPPRAEHMESLAFCFPVVDRRDGKLALHWGETRLLVLLEVTEPRGATAAIPCTRAAAAGSSIILTGAGLRRRPSCVRS